MNNTELTDPSSSSISVVVPVYNSEATLEELVERLSAVLTPMASHFEIILVNDASADASWNIISKLAKQNSNIRGLCMMRNYGQHNALLAGIREAKFDIIVTLDDDLQNPPEEIPKLIRKLTEGHDVVYGTPIEEQHGLGRDLASQMTKLALQGAMGAEVARKISAFRAFRTELRNAFINFQGPFLSIDVLLPWATTQFAAISVRHDPRAVGKSNYTLRKLIAHAINMTTGFSTLPLRLASVTGFAFALLGLSVLAFVVGRYLVEGVSVPGFAFLASIIAIFSGAQLFALGIIGEYLAGMHFRMMDRPTYTLRCTTFDNIDSSESGVEHLIESETQYEYD